MKYQVPASAAEAAFMRKGSLEPILEVQSWRSWQDSSFIHSSRSHSLSRCFCSVCSVPSHSWAL